MTIKVKNTRHVWVYASVDTNASKVNLNAWVSIDKIPPPFPFNSTPHDYSLSRDDMRYLIHSEVQLSQQTATKLAGEMYESEFVIAPKMHMRRRILNL